jgi:hypothetical protein
MSRLISGRIGWTRATTENHMTCGSDALAQSRARVMKLATYQSTGSVVYPEAFPSIHRLPGTAPHSTSDYRTPR